MPLFSLAVFLLICRLAHALVGLTWKVPGAPSSGLKDVTFPISMPDAPHTSGYYFAQQFQFLNVSGTGSKVGYTGLQPRPDGAGGQPVIHAVFSSFVANSTTGDANCHAGADGGPGVSCALDVTGQPYSATYNLTARNTAGTTTWTGTLVNTASGRSWHIGSFSLPAGSQGIDGSQLGFVEYYPWNSGSHTCGSLPYTMVMFGPPYTSAAKGGSLGTPYEYGDCVGKVNFKTSSVGANKVVSVGFK